MNEPTEFAQKTTGEVTVAQLRKAIGKGNVTALRGRPAYGRASYSDAFVFELEFERDGAKGSISVPGWVSNGDDDAGGAFKSQGVFWFLRYQDRLADALSLLPSDAMVSFHVYHDAGTTDELRKFKIHSDFLILNVSMVRRGVRLEYKSILIDTYTGSHGSNRPGA